MRTRRSKNGITAQKLKSNLILKFHFNSSRKIFLTNFSQQNYHLFFITKITILFLFFFLINLFVINGTYSQSVQQEWIRRYPDTLGGNGAGYAITCDESGFIYVGGFVSINYNPGGCVIKYNNAGGVQWMNLCQGSGKSIAVDKSYNVFFAGEMIGQYNNPNYFIVKYDSSGSLKWMRNYDGFAHDEDAIDAMALDNTGNIYVSGHVSQGGNSFVYCTIKYNTLGDSVG